MMRDLAQIHMAVSAASHAPCGQLTNLLGHCALHSIPVTSVEIVVTIKSPLLVETDGEWITREVWVHHE